MKLTVRILFFGSTSDSVIVLNKLGQLQIANCTLRIVAVVTQPARPVGREQTVTPTPVEKWANEHKIPVLTFSSNQLKPWLYQNEQVVIDSLQLLKPDLLVSASYGQKIPSATIKAAGWAGINVHPSFLPRWRGADPVPWAILSGETQTGVTLVTLSAQFDQGLILSQKKIPIAAEDTSDPLRTKLFEAGAQLLLEQLPDYLRGRLKGKPQSSTQTPYAKRLTRGDGYEPWSKILTATETGRNAGSIERKFRAFTPWPGLWTTIQLKIKNEKLKVEEKRLKVLHTHLEKNKLVLDLVQLEGKKPVSFVQFRAAHRKVIPT